MTIAWIACGFNYYLIGILVKYFPGDFNMNNFVMFGSDIPGVLSAGWLCQRWKPKFFFSIYFGIQIVAGLSILLFIDHENPSWLMFVLVGCCRFGVAGAFVGVWINHAKMFPTLFVATSMGISNFFARVTVISAPMVAEVTYPIPVVIFTIFVIVAGVSSLFLVDLEKENELKDAAAQQQKK